MLRIKKIITASFCILLMYGCNVQKVPSQYSINAEENVKNVFGHWIFISYNNNTSGHSRILSMEGELITIQDDSLFILGEEGISIIPFVDVKKARMYLYKNQAGMYAAWTILGLMPNIAGAIAYQEPLFMAIGIPFLLVGMITSIVEAANTNNQLFYPGKSNQKTFNQYSRFPQGLPGRSILKELKLKPADWEKTNRQLSIVN